MPQTPPELNEWLNGLDQDTIQDLLDDMVHDCKGNEAAEINNAGRDAQLEYLSDQFGGPGKLRTQIQSSMDVHRMPGGFSPEEEEA